ncbi:nicotinamide riboside kinase [[Candida] anglica]|uniref:Nicotinamide riboside kinase n=1 Tax=[Candida] anglica TaxID=148631 RepID=A0ABP0EL01_9ASCO
MTKSNPIIIALSGPSSSGKTTIASSLHNLFKDSILIHLDDFYRPEDQIPIDEIKNEQNWDCPEAVDFEKFTRYIEDIKENGIPNSSKHQPESLEGDVELKLSSADIDHFKQQIDTKLNTIREESNEPREIIFVEGFMLYHDPKIISLFDIKLFYFASFKVLKSRRESRKYNTDVGVWVDPPHYFQDIVWPEYEKYHKYLFENQDVNHTLNEYAKNELVITSYKNDEKSSLRELVDWTMNQILPRL